MSEKLAKDCNGEEGRSSGSRAAAHVEGGDQVQYRIVIPTRGRWKPACTISTERHMKNERRPFILVKTLNFLQRQGVAPDKVELWMADDDERQRYEEALWHDAHWGSGRVQLRVGVPGILRQRNHIVKSHAEGAYLVSLDDDIADIHWKFAAGNGPPSPLKVLPVGGFERLIFHAHGLLEKYNSFIWGCATTVGKNPMGMQMDGVSTKNGEINGFCYGFLNRHSDDLLPNLEDATEDAERSLRYFCKDRVILRYRMYCCETKCFGFAGGIQDMFEGSALQDKKDARKVAERRAAARLHEMFPRQTWAPTEKKTCSTLEVNFRPVGGPVVPTTSVTALKAANEEEKLWAETRKADRAAKLLAAQAREHAEDDSQHMVRRALPIASEPTLDAPCIADAKKATMQNTEVMSLVRSEIDIICIDDDDEEENERRQATEVDEDTQELAMDAHSTVTHENAEFEAAVRGCLAACSGGSSNSHDSGVTIDSLESMTAGNESKDHERLRQVINPFKSDVPSRISCEVSGDRSVHLLREAQDVAPHSPRGEAFPACGYDDVGRGNRGTGGNIISTVGGKTLADARDPLSIVPSSWYVGFKWPSHCEESPLAAFSVDRKRARVDVAMTSEVAGKEWHVAVLPSHRRERPATPMAWLQHWT